MYGCSPHAVLSLLLLFHCVCTCFNAEYIWICVKAVTEGNWLVAPSRSPNSFIRAERWTMNDERWHYFGVVNSILLVRRSMINTQRRIFHHTFFPLSVSLAHTLYSTQSLTAECQKKKWIYRFSYTHYLAFLCVHKSGYISLSLCFSVLASTMKIHRFQLQLRFWIWFRVLRVFLRLLLLFVLCIHTLW